MRLLPLAVPVLVLALAASSPARAARATAPAARAPRAAVPFVRDDWPKAMALAKARQLPVFVEAWAPW